MAEAFEQFKQFEYKNNSNLVLQREAGAAVQHSGPTGEPESLVGRLPGRMGDKRMVARIPRELLASNAPFVEIDGIQVRTALQPQRVKKRRLDALLQQLDQAGAAGAGAGGAADEPVAVVFEDSADELAAEDDEDEEGHSADSEAGDEENQLFRGGGPELPPDLPDEEEHHTLASQKETADTAVLSVDDVTAHWLQGQLTERGVVDEAEVAQKLLPLEAQLLHTLALPELQECEAELVELIGVDHFDFIAILLHNRWKVHYLTRLRQAQTADDRIEVENAMNNSMAGRQLLKELQQATQVRDREKAFEESIEAEAARLNEQEGVVASPTHPEEPMVDASQVFPSADAVNLEDLSFKVEDKLIGRDKVKLPKGTERVSAKDWEEVLIPEKTRVVQSSDTIEVEKVVPRWALPCFNEVGIKRLNPIQTRVAPIAMKEKDVNMLVCAPTGAGKTNVAIMAMLEVVSRYLRPRTGGEEGVECALNQFKIIYVSPMKALVAEQVSAFRKRLDFLKLHLKVSELTGDINLSQAEIEATQIIVTTPEKWDVITRKSGERSYTQLVRLMIFDEIHLLHDKRGAVLEALIARALRQYEATGQQIRFLGLSATLPNASDVAMFLRVPLDRGLFVFGGEYRPVPLRQSFLGIKTKSSLKRYEKMNELCFERLMQYAGKHQVLIFCHSRKETARTAKYLRDRAFQSGDITKFFASEADGDVSKEVLATEKAKVVSADLKDLITFGFGIHHAGMQRSDRRLVEDLFSDKHLQVLVSTATLAWGVNLPAHAVIIKGTQVYSPELGRWTELPPLDVIQMIGRAGRPPFDKFGEGIIITQQSQLQYYVSLTNQQVPVESQLVSQLPEILNAEIALGSIRTRHQAADWLLYTYLFVRMVRRPELYKVPEEFREDVTMTQWRVDLVHAALLELDALRLINYEATSGKINMTALCKAASNYYLRPKTVAIFNQSLTSDLNDVDLLRLFGHVQEFSNVPVRPEEKPELAKCVDKVPIPVKGQVGEPATKINILLQAYLSGLKLDGFALQADMGLVVQNAPRIMRAIFDIALRRGWARVAELALTYAKVVDRRMWNSMSPLRQFGVLSLADLKRIEARTSISWPAYFDMTEAELGELLKNQQLGRKIYKLVQQFPKLKVDCFILPVTDQVVQIDMTVSPDFEWNKKISKNAEMFWVFVENVDRTKILYADSLIIERRAGDQEDHYLSFTVALDEPRSPNYFVKVISDRWLGSERIFPISFRDLVIPSKNPSPTSFLGLQPIPVTAINFPEAVKTLFPDLKFFSSLQSQVFQPLYSTDDNVLVCAPHTSGRSCLAEVALLRLLMTGGNSPLCVYLTPNELAAKSRFCFLEKRFAVLGLKVAITTGNLSTDTKLVSSTHILVTRASHWEAVSRRWRARKALQRVNLLLIESIEMVGDPVVGSDIEVAVSRMRLMADLLKGAAGDSAKPLRIVAFGAPVGNAVDLADWIGAKGQLYNFHPTVRASALDLSITRIDIPDRNRRLVASYNHIGHCLKKVEESVSSPTMIVICTERREARQTCIELLIQAAAEHNPKKFLRGQSESELAQTLVKHEPFRERVLKDVLSFGVGLVHDGMLEEERQLVYKLYSQKKLQVLVMTHQLVYELHLTARLVIVQDVEIWTRSRWTKYTAETLTRFLGLSEPDPEDESSAVSWALILCKPARHEEIKRCIFEPLQIESNVDLHLQDHLLSEIVTGTIHSKQECVDWFTWTLAYRRILKNPNFYGLRSADESLCSEYFSEVIETACENLVNAGCLIVEEDDMTLKPTNLGLISVFYALKAATVEGFVKLLSTQSDLRQVLATVTSAKEIESLLQIRQGEDVLLRTLTEECLGSAPSAGLMDHSDVHTKALVLMNAHLKRLALTPDLQRDADELLILMEKCCHALVDVLSSTNRLRQLLAAGELCQMLTQGCGGRSRADSLMQLPHFTPERIKIAEEKFGIHDCFELMNCDDEVRDKLLFDELGLDQESVERIAGVCNALPVLSVKAQMSGDGNQVEVEVTREMDEDDVDVGEVRSSWFPVAKQEQWWLVVASGETSAMLGLKRMALNKPLTRVNVEVDSDKLTATCRLFCVSDSYIGCDRQLSFPTR